MYQEVSGPGKDIIEPFQVLNDDEAELFFNSKDKNELGDLYYRLKLKSAYGKIYHELYIKNANNCKLFHYEYDKHVIEMLEKTGKFKIVYRDICYDISIKTSYNEQSSCNVQ